MKKINNILKIKRIISILFIGFVLSSCTSKNNQIDDIHIFYTADVHCAITESIGYSSLSAYVKQQRELHPYVTLVDLGDFLQDNAKNSNDDESISSLTKGSAIIDIMNVVGYDIITIGNHEFDFGLGYLARRLEHIKADVTLCNVVYKGDLVNPLERAKNYIIKEYDETKVAYIGVTSPEILYKGNESIIKDKNGNDLFYFYEDDLDMYYQNIQNNINQANKETDYVVILSHLGIDNVEGFSSIDLIKNTYGFDVILDSHSHSVIENEVYKNKKNKDVVLSSAGKNLENFGELILKKDHSIETHLIKGYDDNGKPVVMDDDKSVVKKIEEIHNKVYGISE